MEPRMNEQESALPRLRIVALDDDADFRQYLSGQLDEAGHEVRTASTPDELIQACQTRLPDVVLLDMKMGPHTGDQVLAELRKRWPNLCVIVLTGHPSMDNMRSTFKLDVFDYIAKPFAMSELERSLAQAVASLGLAQRPEDKLRAELGRQLRLARAEKGWTLKELSEACDVSISQLSSIERGAHLPSLESLLAIAIALGRKPSAWLSAAGL
jgi:DNA-binding NtrC family response regulator